MKDSERLIGFIQTAKQRQVSDEFLVALLRQHGWSDSRVYQAFGQYYEGVLGQPVPSRGSRIEGAREAFLYLLAFITLGFWVVALILLADQLINHAFPSPLGFETYSRLEVAGQLATLIVSFPLFLWVSGLILKEIERRPESLESGVRKWLTYIALVITAVTLLGDAVAVITSFLSGDLTVRFFSQALILFVITGGVFWYYLGTMRSEGMSPARSRVFGWAATAVVTALVAVGFLWTGSPGRLRAIQVDDRRVGRLANIARTLNSSATNGKVKLPASLDQVAELTADDIKDPVTGVPFDYKVTSVKTYRLCAVFDTDGTALPKAWVHPAGRHCYDLDATQTPAAYYSQN
jgi:hypothetical protein